MTHDLNGEHQPSLLTPGIDPDPAEIKRADSKSPLLLVCDHAGQAIPRSLNNLGLSPEERRLHIAYDIGAEQVAQRLSGALQCTLVLQRYSRLVIDCNRPPGTEQSIPLISDTLQVPGNTGLSQVDRRNRETEIFEPFAQLCRLQIAQPKIQFAFAIHSFTPRMNGLSRPWDIGFLYRQPSSQGDRLLALALDMWPDLLIGENQPYRIEDATDWFIPVCAEARNIPHCLIEIRNDHLLTDDGITEWSGRLELLLTNFMEQTDDPHP